MWSSFAVASLAAVAAAQSDMALSTQMQHILAGAGQGPLNTYPTSLTQGIIPKGFHSHNDYWRPVPLYSALSAGAISVEADVWLYNGTLHVGHERSALTNERTFASLYVDPLLSILKHQNPKSEFVTGATKNGVFDTSSGQTLYLFVDLKTDGAATWPVVIEALKPLRDAGYLSTYNGSVFTSGPVTVVGTGNTPLNLVQGVAPRDYFWDGPLVTLNTTFSNITSGVSPIASVDFAVVFGEVPSGTLNSTQQQTLTEQVAVAHSKGIKVRYWDQPGWPVSTRNAIWRVLANAGVDLINIDDVAAIANF
ncbi:alkaline phosphatase [Ophiostoma piceae UAMH 11346]|uniref:Alkaline phosphatase n=1 Tax=Ophiostoma piceae (strain UAMH 11346) TaxID=1262450 RepID=S3C9P9_OPHP1|nr:alkaline phosphatase [Ophiostoma piceae UAMH 11346]